MSDEQTGSFEELIEGIEAEMNVQRLHKQGAYAVTASRIAGTVLTEAVASGLPYELARDMAADTWNSIMGFHQLAVDNDEDAEVVG
ncbi:hypothetical protein J7I97_16630 [Streptomyces sp. ISL-87]|uniref:hypothetical protein n=1 Tax=Streptomyces sp. ISL-87 TaxID=2819188 RepID=UPI001BE87837|nr:hypothetical protein [Streptomyces sp. ISL-87]MBT2609860.1 hypothetical protein [Streptomyces sp. ISL-87]